MPSICNLGSTGILIGLENKHGTLPRSPTPTQLSVLRKLLLSSKVESLHERWKAADTPDSGLVVQLLL